MEPFANLIGYYVILMATIAACAAIVLFVVNYVCKKLHVVYRIGFIIGRWQRINYLMEHLPKNYWEDHKDWKTFRDADLLVMPEANPTDQQAASAPPASRS